MDEVDRVIRENDFGSKDPLPEVFKKLYVSQTTIKEIVKPKKIVFKLILFNQFVFRGENQVSKNLFRCAIFWFNNCLKGNSKF